MHRLFEWLRAFWQEKINIFIKGFCGGTIVSGIFLFRESVSDPASLIFIGLLKLLLVGVTGIISGCATVLGNDFAAWIKAKWKKITTKRVSGGIRKKKAA
jgi:hypothetical protein